MTKATELNGRVVLTRDAIFAFDDEPEREFVPVPEWASKGSDPDESGVWVQTLNARDVAKWRRLSTTMRGGNQEINYDELTVRLVILSACDESGQRLFADGDDVKLRRKSSKVLERIARAAKRVSGLEDSDAESTRKNSGETEDDD